MVGLYVETYFVMISLQESRMCVFLRMDPESKFRWVVRVKVDTPYFTGNVVALCLENPLYSLIIGKIPNARDPKDPNGSWKLNQTNAVMTRQQSRNESKKPKPNMCVPEIIKSDISPDDIEVKQNDDESLVKIRTMVGQEEVDLKVSYIRKRGIIVFSKRQIWKW